MYDENQKAKNATRFFDTDLKDERHARDEVT